ncbi:hypothetical protein C4552_04245 [Candidatus Parcubacteria bacterium]|nr:MAG: hypothetical protein C4552_04245 [Candidatus Parcubacteria bacterium]
MTIEPFALALAALVAVASGLVGSFALMRRMTLAGDALSHVALPGIGLAILYSINPVLGGAITLIIGTLIIWKVERISALNTDAVIGVLFALSLAVGAIAFEEEHELIEALFGGMEPVSGIEFAVGALVGALVIGFILRYRHALVLSLVSRELAKTAAVPIDRLQLGFLIAFALTVIVGMKFLGVLLMGSLIIVPAATARNVATDLRSMLMIASISALVAVLSGLILAIPLAFQPGPVIILIAGILFIGSLVVNAIQSRRIG